MKFIIPSWAKYNFHFRRYDSNKENQSMIVFNFKITMKNKMRKKRLMWKIKFARLWKVDCDNNGMLLCVAGTLKEKFDGKSIIWSAGESSSSIPFDVTFYFRHQADLNLITAPMGVLLYSSGERKKSLLKTIRLIRRLKQCGVVMTVTALGCNE